MLWLLIVCTACSGLSSEPEIVQTLPPRPTDVNESFSQLVNIQSGAMIYAQNCVSCHGVTGAGDGELVRSGQVTNVPDFTHAASIEDKTLQEWFEVITSGRIEVLMPPWGNVLSASDRWATAFYTYTLSYDPLLVSQGQALYEVNCAGCHGDVGEGTPDGPTLIGLLDTTETSLLHLLNTHSTQTAMYPFASQQDRRAVMQYLRLLSTTTRTLPGAAGPLVQPAATEEIASEIPQVRGTIRGRIIHGTENGSATAGMEVALHTLDQLFNEQVREYVVGDDGNYHFDDVVIRPDFAYIITVNYEDVLFSSEIYRGDPQVSDMMIDVTIYENTSDASLIEIISRAIQMNLTPQGLYMIEVINLTNTSQDYVYLQDQTPTGLNPVSVSFPLPESAQLNPGHTDMNRFVLSETERELFDTQPVLPGAQHYVQFSYLLPLMNNTTFSLLPTAYRMAGSIELYVDFNHLSLEGDGIEFSRNQNFDGDSYRVYTVTDIPAAGEITHYQVNRVIRGLVREEADPTQVLTALLIGSGVILLVIALLINLLQLKKTAAKKTDNLTSADIITQIAQLDSQFAEGKLDTVTYEKQRRVLKSKAILKMKQDSENVQDDMARTEL